MVFGGLSAKGVVCWYLKFEKYSFALAQTLNYYKYDINALSGNLLFQQFNALCHTSTINK